MTDSHSPWPLFCNDLDQAQQWVNYQLECSPTDKQLGHKALSLGLNEKVKGILSESKLEIHDETKRQWKFRLARLSGARNPYSELVPPDLQSLTELQMDHAKRMGLPAVVSLFGGIGDLLEGISMMLEWSRIAQHPLILVVTPEHEKLFSPLVRSIPELTLQSSLNSRAIQSMAMREWICKKFGPIRYGKWILTTIEKQKTKSDALFCWKARGEENLLSAYLRSVPFEDVATFYKKRQKLHPRAILLDISDWSKEETIILQNLGVQCINPRDIGLEGIISIFQYKEVITIDTALAHLCAVAGKNATLLLNYIPDERWVELHRPDNCYGKHLKVVRQVQFCDWEETLTSLLTCTSG